MSQVRATVRLQLHAGFTLRDAAAQVDYYASLGVSHLYLSPIASAVPGSTHGYDVVDPARVNPELGGEQALRELSTRASGHGLGLVLDIVPNHMAAHPLNDRWWDVLRLGRRSAHAHWFDIDWQAPLSAGKVVLPVLDRPLAEALDEGLLRLQPGPDGNPELLHYETRLPLQPGSWPATDVEGWCARLNAKASVQDPEWSVLLAAQAWLPVWWRHGDDRLNYRRFFTITSLVALQVQQPDVFAAVHELPLRLVREGVLNGLRVDHVDGLADPAAYLQRLRTELDAAGEGRQRPLLWVEKILAPGERLPDDWQCDGTTGYDFMDEVAGWLHDENGLQPLTRHWQELACRSGDFLREERQARREVLRLGLRSEFEALLTLLLCVDARETVCGQRIGGPLLQRALEAMLVHFPVYRTYATASQISDEDVRCWQQVLDTACRGEPPEVCAAAATIVRWVIDGPVSDRNGAIRAMLRRRLQQLSAPLNAKAVEDCAFYRHGVLVSRNEVGSRPDEFALTTDQFHERMQLRAARHPQALLATATHDHKRGEDARARLAVVSERPAWWQRQVRSFDRKANLLDLPVPPAEVRLVLWQGLVGSWPVDGAEPDWADFAGRIAAWQVKSVREAGLRSSWTHPDEDFEKQLQQFIEAALLSLEGRPLRKALEAAAEAIAPAGARNSLVQAALRMTVPGIPDLYQGGEGWDLSLVDPDNRRPVDYAQRRQWLSDQRPWLELLKQWQDGAVKARLVRELLQLRSERPALFAEGNYQPLACNRPVPMLAFSRGLGGERLIVAAARFTRRTPVTAGATLAAAHWRDARMQVPPGRYRNVLTGAALEADDTPQRLRTLFDNSPLAIFSTW